MQKSKTCAINLYLEYRAITTSTLKCHSIEGRAGKDQGSCWACAIRNADGKFVQNSMSCAIDLNFKYCPPITIAAF